MRQRWRHEHKAWISDNWKRLRDVSWVVIYAVPYIRKSLRLENAQGSLQSGMPGSNSETRGRFCDDLRSNIVVLHSVGPIITFHVLITARKYVDKSGNRVHSMIYTLFPSKNDAVFQDDSAPIHTDGTILHGLKWMKVNFSIFSGQHNRQIWTSLSVSLVSFGH
jgi:hypothetical protein